MTLNRVGKISYLNTAPFFFRWPEHKFPLLPGVPRELAQAARSGDIVAAPLPIVECWDLEKSFSPLGFWGISVKEECRSVLVFSRRPFAELHNAIIGLTRESSTSVVLCDVLIRQRYGHKVQVRRGLEPTDEAWLVIGDSALQLLESGHPGWPYVTDLAAEWWEWQQLPFVFARWVVKKNSPSLENDLMRTVQESFQSGQRSLAAIAALEAPTLRIPSGNIVSYLKNFDYVLDQTARDSIEVFRDLAERTPLLASPQVGRK